MKNLKNKMSTAAVLLSLLAALAFSSEAVQAGNNRGLNAGQMQSIANLDNMRAQANSSISTAVANGTLSMGQAGLFQNQLNASASEQANYVNSGNFNFVQMQSILTNLQNITNSINTAIATGATNAVNVNPAANPGWYGRRGHGRNDWNNQFNSTYWTGIDNQLAAASARIQDGLNNRFLTQGEYNSLRAQYDQIVNRETQYKNSGGRFSNSERTSLERQIDDLNRSITREVTDRENNRRGRWH